MAGFAVGEGVAVGDAAFVAGDGFFAVVAFGFALDVFAGVFFAGAFAFGLAAEDFFVVSPIPGMPACWAERFEPVPANTVSTAARAATYLNGM
ncbi:MAG: hypothetical protein M3O61_04845 [Gemmatimonadota bacterium]|nr:hypothetical protein [Gemmatimonadota bacterium]